MSDTTNMSLWPPPTKGLCADDLKTLSTIAEQLIEHIKGILPETCASEGHKWDSNVGQMHEERHGGEWIEPDPDSFCSQGFWRDASWEEVFVRTCVRCGSAEKKPAIKQPSTSPFKS